MTPDNEAPHPSTELDDFVHQRARLGVLTVLAEVRRADFSYLKTVLHLTDGNLGRHLEALNQAGLVDVSRTFNGKRPRTWVQITAAGEHALQKQLDALKQIIGRVEGSSSF